MSALLVGCLMLAGCEGGPKTATYMTATVERGDMVGRVTATGTLSALVTVQVGSQVSGRIAALMVDFNSRVKKGQVIARIDPQLFEAAAEQARANHAVAQGNLTKAKVQAEDAERQLARAEKLRTDKLISESELDTARANAGAARAQVAVAQGALEQAKAALHQAQINLEYTTIRSPIDGVVISRSVDVGQTVAASLQAPTLFTIAEDLRKMQVDTSVAEADVGKLKAAMEASFTVDAFPGERFRGQVRQIRDAPQTVQNVVTYDAVIDVANPELKLKPGMTANVTFVWAERKGALRVPSAALRFRPSQPPTGGRAVGSGGAPGSGGPGAAAVQAGAASGGGPGSGAGGPSGGFGGLGGRPGAARAVYLLRGGERKGAEVRGGELERREVKAGLVDGSMTEIVEGLVEGDVVVVDQKSERPQGSGPPPFRRGL